MKRPMISLLTAVLLSLSTLVAGAVSADSGSAFSRRECTHPTIGFPTCYVLQADGMWAREEFVDINTNWVTVRLVTFDEVVGAVGDANAIAP